eukprot:12037505-Karenia_brevis.AAC.1
MGGAADTVFYNGVYGQGAKTLLDIATQSPKILKTPYKNIATRNGHFSKMLEHLSDGRGRGYRVLPQ